MSRPLVVLFIFFGSIAIPVVSVLIINACFELVRSLYPFFLRELFINQVRWTSELDVDVSCMASVLASNEEEMEKSNLSWSTGAWLYFR